MHSGSQDHSFLRNCLLRSPGWVGDGEQVDSVSCEAPTQGPEFAELRFDGAVCHRQEEALQVSVRVRVEVCKEASVLVMRKLHGPCETVRGLLAVPRAALVVLDFLPFSPPANAAGAGIQLGVHERLHPYGIEALGFQQVDDGEAIGDVFPGVLNSKIKPLSVLVCVEVSSQGEFILVGVSGIENTEASLCNSTRPSKNKYCFLLIKTDLATTEKPAVANIYFLFSLVFQFMYQASRNLGKENSFGVGWEEPQS